MTSAKTNPCRSMSAKTALIEINADFCA